LLAIGLICLSSLTFAQNSPTPLGEETNTQVQFVQAVDAARNALDVLEQDLQAEKKLLEEIMSQQQIYRTQINSLRNFLIVPDISASVIGKGLEEVDISTTLLQSKMQKAGEREANILQTLSSVHEKIKLIEERIKEAESMPKDFSDRSGMDRTADIKKFKAYHILLEKQKKVLLALLEIVTSEIKSENELVTAFKEIRLTLKKEIKDRKGDRLFQRNEIELKTFSPPLWVKRSFFHFQRWGICLPRISLL